MGHGFLGYVYLLEQYIHILKFKDDSSCLMRSFPAFFPAMCGKSVYIIALWDILSFRHWLKNGIKIRTSYHCQMPFYFPACQRHHLVMCFFLLFNHDLLLWFRSHGLIIPQTGWCIKHNMDEVVMFPPKWDGEHHSVLFDYGVNDCNHSVVPVYNHLNSSESITHPLLL